MIDFYTPSAYNKAWVKGDVLLHFAIPKKPLSLDRQNHS